MNQNELRLREFLSHHALEDTDVDNILEAALNAFDRAERRLPNRSDLAKKSRLLAKAASELRVVLRECDDLNFYLRNGRTIASDAPWNQSALSHGRAMGALLNRMPADLQNLEEAAALLVDPTLPSSVLIRKGPPIDEARVGLAFELASLFAILTGKDPTISGEATLESPGTRFGDFVALAAACRPYGATLDTGFASFLRSAKAQHDSGVLKPKK